jgi:hypothetical protein
MVYRTRHESIVKQFASNALLDMACVARSHFDVMDSTEVSMARVA